MKKMMSILILAVMVFSIVGMVSADETTITDEGGGLTIIAGKIYNADYTSTIAGATVEVTCGGLTMEKTSESDGAYSVEYDEAICNEESDLSVYAYKEGVGENTVSGQVHENYPVEDWNLNLGVVNVPLVPEFGLIIGGLTIMGALGVFFIVRRN